MSNTPDPRNATPSTDFEGDLSFDALFSDQPDASPGSPTTAPLGEGQPPPEPFLRAGETVYKTAEEAVKGVVHKDEVIRDLRQRYIEATGKDPLTGKPVMPPAAPEELNYAADPSRYYQDLSEAVSRGDALAYAKVQARFNMDLMAPMFNSVGPVIQETAKERALAQVEREIQGFRSFRDSAEFEAALTDLPEVKQAIELAESNFAYAQKLPQLYKAAYLVAQGRKVPELLKQAQPAVAGGPPTQAPRPTLQPTTPTPPSPSAPPSLDSKDGRKAIIEEARRRGIETVVF